MTRSSDDSSPTWAVLFERLTSLDPAARAMLLEKTRSEDPALAAELEALLSAHDRTGPLDWLTAKLTPRVSVSQPGDNTLSGTRVAHYEVGPLLGRGGMGDVYRARDTRLGREVALKFLDARLDRDPDLRGRFVAEARVVCSIDHPNVCGLYDLGEAADGRLFLIMPYYEGETLKERLARGPLPTPEALHIALQVVRGLSAAHERGVVHRDIKPANLLVSPSGRLKILDFGVAKLADITMTRPGETPGTPSYMSPEQRAGEDVDPRSDLWSLGAVLHQMLTGALPSDAEVAPGPVDALPRPVADVVARLLSPAPGDRYPNAEAVQRALEQAAHDIGAEPGLPKRESTGPGRAVRALVDHLPASGLGRWALVGLAAGLLLFGAAWWALGARPPAAPASDTDGAGEPAVASAARDPGVAVLPFRVVGLDSVWGRGMVDLLSINLDEVPGLRALDPRWIDRSGAGAAGSAGRGVEAPPALAHARNSGARYAITGSAIRGEGGDAIRLFATLRDLADGSRRGTARVDGIVDDIPALVDALTLEILRLNLIRLGGEVPPLNVSRVTTASLPALAAYLEGEQKFRKGLWEEAIADFHRAVEIDSTFPRALYRLAGAYGWSGRFPEWTEYLHEAARYADRLPERDALLISGVAREDLQALRRYATRYPDDPQGWFEFGDVAFHLHGVTLEPPTLYQSALGEAFRLAPHYAEAFYHLIHDAFAWRDRDRARELLDTTAEGGSLEGFCPILGAVWELAWGDARSRDRAAAAVDTASYDTLSCAHVGVAAAPEAVERLEEVSLERLRLLGQGANTVAAWRMLAVRLWNGQPDAARRMLAQIEPAPGSAPIVAGHSIMLHLSGYPDRRGLGGARTTLAREPMAEADLSTGYTGHVLNHFWLGALAVSEERWDDVARSVDAIDAIAREVRGENALRADTTAAFADALAEFAHLRRGNFDRLTDFKSALARLTSFGRFSTFPAHYLQFRAGALLQASGRLADAERFFLSADPYNTPYFVPAQFQLGRIYERQGRIEEARQRYLLLAEWWKDADPELQPRRNRAIDALRRLTPRR